MNKYRITTLTALLLALLCLAGCVSGKQQTGKGLVIYDSPAGDTPAGDTPEDEGGSLVPVSDAEGQTSACSMEFLLTAKNSAAAPSPANVLKETGAYQKAGYTVMLYLNGADLETDMGCATFNLAQICDLELDDEKLNVVIMTGGTKEWQNDVIPQGTTALSYMYDGAVVPFYDLGALNMGDPSTLTFFIDYTMQAFPAEHYGLVLWDHGSGTIGEFGCDELFDCDGLSLAEFKKAFSGSMAKNRKLDFVGFDACLMATVENAYVLKDYTHYLIASEELEPGEGWDYSFLETLSKNTSISTEKLGRKIADDYIKRYKNHDSATMSVIRTAKTPAVVKALEALYSAAEKELSSKTFAAFSDIRKHTKSFGSAGPRGGDSDMVDIIDLAANFSDKYPKLADAVADSAEAAVAYSNACLSSKSYGISTFYPFANKSSAIALAGEYKKTGVSSVITKYMTGFARLLQTGHSAWDNADLTFGNQLGGAESGAPASPAAEAAGAYEESELYLSDEEIRDLSEIYMEIYEPIEEGSDMGYLVMSTSGAEVAEDGRIATEFDGYLPMINGEPVCLYELELTDDYERYAIPCEYNGQDADLILIFDAKHPKGYIAGVQLYDVYDGYTTPNRLIKLKKGDKLAYVFYAEVMFEEGKAPEGYKDQEWFVSDAFTYDGKLEFGFYTVEDNADYYYCFNIVDVYQNNYYTDFIKIWFKS